MDHRQTGGRVDGPVNALPGRPQLALQAAKGGGRQWQEQQPGGEAHKKVPARTQLAPEFHRVQLQFRGPEQKQVRAGIEKGKQTQHAPVAQQHRPPQPAAQRRGQQGEQEKTQGPDTGFVQQHLLRVRPQTIAHRAPDQPGQGQQGRKKNHQPHQKNLRRFMP